MFHLFVPFQTKQQKANRREIQSNLGDKIWILYKWSTLQICFLQEWKNACCELYVED